MVPLFTRYCSSCLEQYTTNTARTLCQLCLIRETLAEDRMDRAMPSFSSLPPRTVHVRFGATQVVPSVHP